MPLLKRKPFKRNPIPEGIKDSDEVFYCEQTKEVFKTYDEFFERVMLTNSVIWQCSLTGRPDLTFAEALESEKTAQKALRQFPSALRGPVLFVASLTKRSALKELVDDVFNFTKDRFFKDEKIDVMNSSGKGCRFCKVAEVIIPKDIDNTKICDEPLQSEYRMEAIDDEKEPQSWVVKGELLRRDRTVFSREKTKLFLKQHVEAAQSLLKVKDESIKKYITDRDLKVDQLFVGKLPDFEVSKKLQQQKEKQTSKRKSNGSKEKSDKPETKKKKGNGKNGDITKYLNSSKELTEEQKKKRDGDAKKFREEMEAMKKKKADLEAEKKKKAEEDRLRIIAKTHAALKEHNQMKEDLELVDQKVIPKGKPVSTLMDINQFGDIIRIIEFFHSFPEVLGVKHRFPFGLTLDVIERALMMKEINGPLSDIFQALLSAIFTMQIEEEGEVEIEYRTNNGDIPLRHPMVEKMKKSASLHNWMEKNLRTKINDLAIDSTSVTEILRLHLLSSGATVTEKASKYRSETRGGYKSQEDPGLQFVQNHPQIINFLTQSTVFELSTKDIIKVIHCLIDQMLSFSNIRDLIDERQEQSSNAKLEFKNLKIAESRRERKVAEEKKALQENHKIVIAGFAEEKPEVIEALMKNAEADLEKSLAKIDFMSAKEHAVHLKELKAQVSVFFNHQTYLGCDRAFRNYYIFESMPGIFVEHDLAYSGKCMDRFVKNNAALAHCTKEQKYQIIKQMIKNEEGAGNDDKENKVDVNGTEKAAVATVKKENDADLQRDLFMCNCDPDTCAVHSDSPDRTIWSFYHTIEEVEALIESLNPKGFREKNLLESLDSCREQIAIYIKNCPISKITVELNEREKAEEMKRIVRRMTKKYDNAYFGQESTTRPMEIIEWVLRGQMLEFEEKVTMGCLGKLKVTDRLLWRREIHEGGYNALDDDFKWGLDLKKQTPHGKTNGVANGNAMSENGDANDDEDDKLSAVSSSVGGDDHPVHVFDSGNCSEESDESNDGKKLNTSILELEAMKMKTKNLAMALIQIEQSIEIKYFQAPFRSTKLKDKASIQKSYESCKMNLIRWEQSLMKSTNYSQICLHFNIIHDSILWNRSAQKSGCMICRKKSDPEQTLLCDECNKGYHMYCLKPKMLTVPKGDWFCPKCRPENFKETTTRKRRQIIEIEEEEEEEDENDEQEESEDEEDEIMDTTQEEDDVCHVCQNAGSKLISCTSCEFECHLECAKPPVAPRKVKTWKCSKCVQSDERNQRLKRRRVDKDEDGESADESEDEKPAKSKKVEKPPAKRSSKRYYESDDSQGSDYETPAKKNNDDRRSGRRSNRQSRRNSSEEEMPKPSRRSSKKFVESSVERRASRRSFDPFNTISLNTLIDEVIKNKNAWPFLKPVSASEVPDYYDVIKQPMDFGKIKSKLNLGDYRTNEQAMRDFEKVFYNCDLYNNAESEIYQAGVKLEKFVIKRSKELNLGYKPSDMSSY